MSWSLSASGHSDDPELEKTLAAAVGQALAQASTIVSTAGFYGNGFSGDPRELATEVTQ